MIYWMRRHRESTRRHQHKLTSPVATHPAATFQESGGLQTKGIECYTRKPREQLSLQLSEPQHKIRLPDSPTVDSRPTGKVLREMDSAGHYFGSCTRCSKAVCGEGRACRAMGHLFHTTCFTCSVCSKILCGKPFYTVSGQIYCVDDFLFSGVHLSPEVCNSCGEDITDLVLQARGKSYHPSCFRCVICRENLEGQPFTVDSDRRVYCVSDYHRVQAPRCAACGMPILPTEGSTESIRVATCNKNYHVECYTGEVDLI